MEELIAALEREASVEAETKLERARREAAELLAACREELTLRMEDDLERREQVLRAQMALAAGRARRAGRSEVLRARDALLGRVRMAAQEHIAGLETDPDYLVGLAEELREALGFLAEGPAEVRCRPALVAPLVEALEDLKRGDVQLREEPSLGTGFVVRALDGHAEVDARLGARLERMWPELALLALATAAERGWVGGAARE
jgi:vacuolar-type H+-ATPase subunit E/Vma4